MEHKKESEDIMDLTKLTEEKLKSMAYDEMVKAQTAQSNVQVINRELANRKPVKEKNDGKDK